MAALPLGVGWGQGGTRGSWLSALAGPSWPWGEGCTAGACARVSWDREGKSGKGRGGAGEKGGQETVAARGSAGGAWGEARQEQRQVEGSRGRRRIPPGYSRAQKELPSHRERLTRW